MALIKCTECGKEISDCAERCPNCGCTTKAGQDKAEMKGLGVSGMIGLVLGVIGFIMLWNGNYFWGFVLAIVGAAQAMSIKKKIDEANERKDKS